MQWNKFISFLIQYLQLGDPRRGSATDEITTKLLGRFVDRRFVDRVPWTSMIGNGQGETEIPVDPAKQVTERAKVSGF